MTPPFIRRESHAGPAFTPAARLLLLLLPLAAGLSLLPRMLASPASTPAPAAVVLRIDPNTAPPAELELLPRIGPALAAAIVEYRTTCGHQPAFKRPADLAAVRGIGPRTVERLRPMLYFAHTTPQPKEAATP